MGDAEAKGGREEQEVIGAILLNKGGEVEGLEGLFWWEELGGGKMGRH